MYSSSPFCLTQRHGVFRGGEFHVQAVRGIGHVLYMLHVLHHRRCSRQTIVPEGRRRQREEVSQSVSQSVSISYLFFSLYLSIYLSFSPVCHLSLHVGTVRGRQVSDGSQAASVVEIAAMNGSDRDIWQTLLDHPQKASTPLPDTPAQVTLGPRCCRCYHYL